MKLKQIKFAALLLSASLATAFAQTNSLNLPPIAAERTATGGGGGDTRTRARYTCSQTTGTPLANASPFIFKQFST